MLTCQVEDCERSAAHADSGRCGYCSKHYRRVRVHGDPNFVEKVHKYPRNNLPPLAERDRYWHLHGKYGLHPADYDRMFAEQQGRCGICGNTSVKTLSVDHNHETGQVRGLLCRTCNSGIGLLREDVGLLLKAAEWVALKPIAEPTGVRNG